MGVDDGGAGEQPGGWVQAQGLGEDAAGQRQLGQVLVRRGTAVEDGVDLGVQPLFDVGMLGQKVQRPPRAEPAVSVPPMKNVTTWSAISASDRP